MKSIIVAYDFSNSSKHALDIAVELGEKFTAHIYLLHVVDPDPSFIGYKTGPDVVRDQIATRLHIEHKELQSKANQIRAKYQNITALLVQGAVVETILSQIDKLSADLIVVSANNRNKLEEILLGSTSKRLINESSIPVLVCK